MVELASSHEDDPAPAGDALLHGLVEVSPIATLIVTNDEQQRIVRMNRRFTELFGFTLEHVWNLESWWSRAYPDPVYREAIRRRWTESTLAAIRAGRSAVDPVEADITCLDDSVRHVEVHLGLFGTRGIVHFNDLTDRKRTERELLEARGFLQAVVDQSPSMILVKDARGKALFVNRYLAEYYGSTPEEILSKATDATHPQGAQALAFSSDDQEVIRTRRRVVREEANTAPNGEEHWFHTVKVPLVRPDGRVDCLGIATDITERRKAEAERLALESQVQQAQKLESLGLLAGGIAHDFNNLLTAMLGHVVLARESVGGDAPVQASLSEIETAALRAADLTRQMLAYSGRSQLLAKDLELDAIVREMNNLLRTAVSKKATFRLELAPAAMSGDATQIRQIVMNLITNASDAVGERTGTVTVRTFTRRLSGDELFVPVLQQTLAGGEYAHVEVSDTGSGMNEETLRRMFEPFFTTKFAGRGLGLAAVLGIVKAHGGGLRVKSAPDAGTIFTVFFPALDAKPQVTPPSRRPAPTPRTRGTVLVVDDEEAVRRLVRSMLEGAGFRVILAADGREGLAAFQRERDGIDAIVLDLTMPRMDGWEVLSELERMQARVPALLVSGYGGEAPPEQVYQSLEGFLAKPFRPDELVARVSEMVRAFRAGSDASPR